MKAASEDLEARKPVWSALSGLFLDTDTSLDRDRRAAILAASPYSIRDVERILSEEVAPVLRWKRIEVPGGEWAAFDDDWLESRILARIHRRWRFPSFGRELRSSEWQATRAAMEAIRTRGGRDD